MIQILIAEDQTILRNALESLLNLEEDIHVAGAVSSGASVRSFPGLWELDLLLMDIEMPDGTGLETAKYMKQHGFKGKIALLTTFSRPGYIEQAMKLGVDGYLLKDDPIDQLIVAIRRIVAGEHVISPALSNMLFRLQPNPLNDREQEMLRRVRNGESTETIASAMHLSLGTVRNYLSSAMQKLETTNRHDALRIAEEKGWI
ncbi:response regulator transcription factor [Shouchella clausii]|uniref:response regulator transcription factor n=1 Tax=Shouchella clausii TaxID=79880 RepID=UPI000BA5D2D1|nr:response regulator transcription factor [Shouchella clausii]PAD42262.1 hypothetical protein CHH54_13140 [Bacillus sp. 7520-S]PAD94228.1 hypothetical protein CHH52_00355 [Shouchella clausii]